MEGTVQGSIRRRFGTVPGLSQSSSLEHVKSLLPVWELLSHEHVPVEKQGPLCEEGTQDGIAVAENDGEGHVVVDVRFATITHLAIRIRAVWSKVRTSPCEVMAQHFGLQIIMSLLSLV